MSSSPAEWHSLQRIVYVDVCRVLCPLDIVSVQDEIPSQYFASEPFSFMILYISDVKQVNGSIYAKRVIDYAGIASRHLNLLDQ
jgi:hypothetical protein